MKSVTRKAGASVKSGNVVKLTGLPRRLKCTTPPLALVGHNSNQRSEKENRPKRYGYADRTLRLPESIRSKI